MNKQIEQDFKSPPKVKDLDIILGERLKEVRILKQFSQKRLAQEIGVTFQQIQKYENGKNRISASTLFMIAKVFSMNIEDFFPKQDEPRVLIPQDKYLLKIIASWPALGNSIRRALADITTDFEKHKTS